MGGGNDLVSNFFRETLCFPLKISLSLIPSQEDFSPPPMGKKGLSKVCQIREEDERKTFTRGEQEKDVFWDSRGQCCQLFYSA